MTDKDFGLAGVTDKLKRPPGKSASLTQDKGKSYTVEPVTVSPDKGEPDFREEALARLNNPNAQMLQQAVQTAKRKPRIGVYSPIVSATAEYLRETVPKYSASDEARKILEEEFGRRYPELVRRIKAEMEQD
jgi:hypothetical protein